MPRAHLDRQPREVAGMFDAVADRYDRMNAVMTLGQERRWRELVADALEVNPGDRVLDLAAGTGASAVPIQRRGASVVACDFSLGMLSVGRRRHPSLEFAAGDALALPFSAGGFDAVTISFGLRNVADVDLALTELARVTRPGGRLVVLETSAPRREPFRAGHRFYVTHVLPRLAALVTGDAQAYDYLAESVAQWPAPAEVSARLAAAGWTAVGWRTLSFGAVAMHRATRTGPARH